MVHTALIFRSISMRGVATVFGSSCPEQTFAIQLTFKFQLLHPLSHQNFDVALVRRSIIVRYAACEAVGGGGFSNFSGYVSPALRD